MSKLDDVLVQIKALKEQFKTTASEALKDLTTDFFAQHPEIKMLTWTQYAPYFNDGDPCVFHVHEVGFVPTDEGYSILEMKVVEESEYDGDEYATAYDLPYDYVDSGRVYKNKAAESLGAALVQVQSLLGQIEGVLEDVFGDGVRVFINADGSTETEEHDHD